LDVRVEGGSRQEVEPLLDTKALVRGAISGITQQDERLHDGRDGIKGVKSAESNLAT
jgi:hypothetical protein